MNWRHPHFRGEEAESYCFIQIWSLDRHGDALLCASGTHFSECLNPALTVSFHLLSPKRPCIEDVIASTAWYWLPRLFCTWVQIMLLKLRFYTPNVCRYGLLWSTDRWQDQHHQQLDAPSCNSMGLNFHFINSALCSLRAGEEILHNNQQ